jgi:hypothetical protein
MNGKEMNYVRDTIENEGFMYAFKDYTDFEDEVKDAEFHKLRKSFLDAAKALAEYVGIEDY